LPLGPDESRDVRVDFDPPPVDPGAQAHLTLSFWRRGYEVAWEQFRVA
jgi:hypothetical protein